ncbi:conserved hypothetical protein [Theileria orientalis strain Shintoku]|uniref:Uncharacterized protein n=1 Tax=Theileria orientalis strain Shintoku TaxID=869250 RepID=J4DPT5_THEOR|nr:conserved hypothetical protein [Theileria orientalis strain Shintoku]BAM41264.1 conserved hypothetical protein [Theileria orientalis strain Shintoku]|eukprot:XP_009691565.1 conserved hypothetical protein [Theileria orientalis strain Shintoku]
MNYLTYFSIFFFYKIKQVISSLPDVDNKVKIPEALTPEQYQKVDKLVNNQDYIDYELKDQLKRLGELHSSIGKLTGKESTVNSMEAPVIYLEPPLILPKSQIKTDEEVENFLKKVGLEDETNDKSDDPYKITNIDDAKTTESSIKSKLAKMRKTREDMFKKMRTLSIKIPGDPEATREFNNLKIGLKKLDDALENQIKKLTQVEHVKAALIDLVSGILR